MSDIRIVRLDGSASPSLMAACEPLLDHDEQKRAAAFQLAAAKQQFVVGRALVRVCLSLAAENGRAPRDWSIRQTPAGKPFVPGGPFFNLSHAERVVACATSGESELGLDVEGVRQTIDLHAMAKALTATERSSLEQLTEVERARQFAEFWTAKEAAAKALGEGVSVDFRKVLLRRTGDGFDVSGSAGDWQVWQTDLAPNHVLAVATKHRTVPTLHSWSATEFIRAIKTLDV